MASHGHVLVQDNRKRQRVIVKLDDGLEVVDRRPVSESEENKELCHENEKLRAEVKMLKTKLMIEQSKAKNYLAVLQDNELVPENTGCYSSQCEPARFAEQGPQFGTCFCDGQLHLVR